MPMSQRSSWLLWASWTVLLLFALQNWKVFCPGLGIGIVLGLAVSPRVVPLLIRSRRRRP
jgi:Flp pilus assembly protein TadB